LVGGILVGGILVGGHLVGGILVGGILSGNYINGILDYELYIAIKATNLTNLNLIKTKQAFQ